MAYCPECGSEYRKGYTRCNLCDRLLVEQLPEDFEEPTIPKSKRRPLLSRHEPLSRSEVGKRLKYLAWVVLFLLAFLWVDNFLSGIISNISLDTNGLKDVWYLSAIWFFTVPSLLSVYLILACVLTSAVDKAHRKMLLTVITCLSAGLSIMLFLGLMLSWMPWLFRRSVPGQAPIYSLLPSIQYVLLTLFGAVSAYFAFTMSRGSSNGRLADGSK